MHPLEHLSYASGQKQITFSSSRNNCDSMPATLLPNSYSKITLKYKLNYKGAVETQKHNKQNQRFLFLVDYKVFEDDL